MKRLLVVDDDPNALDALRSLLELDGYEVVAETSPVHAAARLEHEDFDALVTDLEMPGLHGVELARAAISARPNMPIVVVTAYAGSPASEQALALGARCVLPKPLDYDGLVAELGRAVA